MSVLTLLGTMVISMMRSATRLWQRAEARRMQDELVTRVFDALREDLANLAVSTASRTRQVPAVKFLADVDEDGRQRLMFVRSLGAYHHLPFVRQAGNFLDDDRDGSLDEESFNMFDDDGDGRIDEDLEALGGYMEVAYTLRGDTLYRAFESPADARISDILGAQKQVLADGIIHFQVLFWGPRTGSWDADLAPFEGGAERVWDSTRGILDAFTYHLGDESVEDTRDDLFPSMVQMHLIVFDYRVDPSAVIGRDIHETDDVILLENASIFGETDTIAAIRVDDEWMTVEMTGGVQCLITERGIWGTKPAAHLKGALARSGRSVRITMPVPRL